MQPPQRMLNKGQLLWEEQEKKVMAQWMLVVGLALWIPEHCLRVLNKIILGNG